MILLVNDANILIDLLKIGLTESFFQLHYDFHVADLVKAEIKEKNLSEIDHHIRNGILTLQRFTFEELGQIQNLKTEHPPLSIPDCSCLFLCRKLSAKLLTGDGLLRRTAESRDIKVHGILWVFDEMVERGIITKQTAAEKMRTLMELNSRLPKKECKARLKRWQKEDADS